MGWRRRNAISCAGLVAVAGLLVVGVVSTTASRSAAAPVAASAPGSAGHATGYLSGPIAADEYLAAQRKGYGSPRQAAERFLAAERAAAVIDAETAETTLLGSAAAGRTRDLASTPWTSLGPTPMSNGVGGDYAPPNSGRVDSLAVSTSGTIFVGTAGGGMWSSTNNGASWTTTTDRVATGLAIGALAADPANSQIVYAGTGEANGCGDCFYGAGVLKSVDGGATWSVQNPGGVFTGADFASLIVDPHNDQVLYAGTSEGFFESSDGGATWAPPSGSYAPGAVSSVAIDPSTSPTTIYIATVGDGVQVSTDGGENFAATGTGLPPASKFGVTALAIGTPSAAFPAANQDLYAAVQLNGTTNPENQGDVVLCSSTNSGSTWIRLKTPAYTNQSYSYGLGNSDQAWYDNTLAVDPANPSHVIAGGIALIESTDGGATWTNVNGGPFFGVNVTHPDQHALLFTNGKLLIGNDGGVYEYNGTAVSNLNSNLDTGQFYEDLGVYANGTDLVGGLQDNGSVTFDGTVRWPEIIGGDGGYSAINPLDPNQQFAEADEQLYATTDQWTTSQVITPPQLYQGPLPKYPGGPEPALPSNFVPPMTVVPNPASVDAPTVYFGADNLYETTDPADSQPTWTQLTDHANSDVSAVAVAASDANDVYVGFDDGTLLVSTNATAAVPTFSDISPGVADWITHIAVSPSNPGSIAVTFSNNNTQFVSEPPMVSVGAVALTGTPSASYTDITGNLPTGVASNSVVFDQGDLVVATDVGTFLTSAPDGASTSWSAAGTGLPNVQVIGLTVDAAGDVYAATHGRGVWEIKVPSAPVVTVQPVTTRVTAPGAATFTAAASGSPVPAVQWQMSSDGGKTYTNVTGGTTSTLAVTRASFKVSATSLSESGRLYRAVFTSGANAATTAPAQLVVEPVTVETASLPVGAAGKPYAAAATAAGGLSPYEWSRASGPNPPGVTFSSAGLWSGTPTKAGTYDVTVKATDTAGSSGSRTLKITITGPLAIVTTSLPAGKVGTKYSASVVATGGISPYTWARTAGSKPGGLSFSAGGAWSGTPTQAGTFSFTVQVTDKNGTKVSKVLKITVARR